MKYEIFGKYEKPALEEIELELEGSFLQDNSYSGEIGGGDQGGTDWD